MDNPNNNQSLRKKKNDNKWLGESLVLFARFSSWVIAPVLLGALAGRWLDSKYNQGGQLFFLACIGLSFIISMVGLVIEAGKEYKKIDDSYKKKDKK